MLVVSFPFSGVSFILSIWMNDKGDVIRRFSFFLNAVRGNIVRIYVMSHWTVDLHHDENVFLPILRTHNSNSYVSEIYGCFHFWNAIPWSPTFFPTARKECRPRKGRRPVIPP